MKPIADGIFTTGSQPQLIGGRSRTSGRIVFPCPEGDEFVPFPLRRTGTVWSYTIQRFRPKSPPYMGPEVFEPFCVAYVELPGEVIVESRLVNIEFGQIRIGLPVELTLVPLDFSAGDGTVLIHAFQPVSGSQIS